jgi:glycosyltransferase involved in cell wall biosynthesis
VYQRYSVHDFAGLQLARRLRVPFVLEYNGSEIWMSRHWSRRLKYEALAERIELLNVRGADLVVVVSRAMRDELAARGIDASRILVNPNGVDPDRYTPSVDSTAVTRRLGLAGKTVVGFISTFQPWHGAQVLADAFARLIRENPAYADSVRLLMIGAGPELPAVKRRVEAAGLGAVVSFTGLVEQEAGPEYLAACDILASPHVPNADGSPFFGSPTKLFEYMAMGKAIVASDLDQIGEVLRHGETAWMVPPADVAALTDGMKRLIDDPALRTRLGASARGDVLLHHTWRAHVRSTLDALEARLDANAA